MRRAWVGLAATILAASAGVRLVRADDDSDRASLLREIDGYLHDAADKVSRAGSADGTREVDDARGLVQKAFDRLSALARVKGSDSRAGNYVDRYGSYARDFDRAAQQLGAMKTEQRSLADLAKRCTDLDKGLTDIATRAESDKDGSRMDELRRTANTDGDQADNWMRDADHRRDDEQRRASDARGFSVSDGEWSGITSGLRDSASRSLEAWLRDYTAADQACKPLRQREHEPAVEHALSALANTSAGKEQIYSQLVDKMSRIEADLRGAVGDSSSSRLAEALSLASDIDKLVSNLASVRGADAKAGKIVDGWPDSIRGFQRSAPILVGLKDAEYELDDVPKKCTAAAAELNEQMDRYMRAKDPNGLTEIPARAATLGEKYTTALGKVDAMQSVRQRAVTDAADVSVRDDRWAPVQRAAKETAQALFDYWDKARVAAHSACDDLARGTRNPAVEKFTASLGAQAQSDLADFQALAAAWERDARDIYQLDCHDMQDLWDAWCSIEVDASPEQSAVEQQTATIIDREFKKIDGVLDRLPPLRRRADELRAKPKYRDAVEKLVRDVFDKQEPRLRRLRAQNGDWKGSNNPALAFVADYGKQAHARKNREHNCNVYDQAFPGVGRPDCVVVLETGTDRCFVYEFKSDTYRGNDHLEDYRRGVSDYYTKQMRDRSKPPSELGGPTFQAIVEKNCKSSSGDLVFQGKRDDYPRCAKRYECVHD
ncbi:MAG TPA: hypothetical protein VGM88_04505 [Kofleriaceae bacterium]|jgi:hypothetical protein